MYTGKTPMIGDVFMASFNGVNNVQSGYRPALVFQNNVGNKYSPNVIVFPLTSNLKKKHMPTHVVIPATKDTGLSVSSMVLCENPVCMSKESLIKYYTRIPDEYMEKVTIAYLLATSAISYIGPTTFTSILEKAKELNSVV